MFEQVRRSSSETRGIVAELPEPGVAGAADHPAKQLGTMIMVDVQRALFSCRSLADRTTLHALYRSDDARHLIFEPERADAATGDLLAVSAWVFPFPLAFGCKDSFTPLSRQGVEVASLTGNLALLAMRPRFWCSARPDSKARNGQAASAVGAYAVRSSFVTTRTALLGDIAFRLTARGTPVVAVHHRGHTNICDSGLGPVCVGRA